MEEEQCEYAIHVLGTNLYRCENMLGYCPQQTTPIPMLEGKIYCRTHTSFLKPSPIEEIVQEAKD